MADRLVARVFAPALCLLAAAPASAQLLPQQEAIRVPPSVVLRPAEGEPIPKGGLFVAGFTYGDEQVTSASFTAPDAPDELRPLSLFERCVRGTSECTWQSRFPLEQPEGDDVVVEVHDSFDDVGQAVLVQPVAADLDPPQGLDTVEVMITEEEPTLFRRDWLYFVEVSAPDLDPTEVALLELYDVTEGDKDLRRQAIVQPWWTEPEMRIVASIDLPESGQRCYSLEATTLGGTTAATDPRCVDIVLAQGCSHTGAPASSAGSGLALLALLVAQLARARRSRAGGSAPTASS